MANLKHVKELCKFAESQGLSTKTEMRGGTHVGIKLILPSGESTTMIIGASISDRRGVLNNRAFIKRFVRQHTTGEKNV
jgi:hypothetical protein